jgi:undecaprenyl-diphosphatase
VARLVPGVSRSGASIAGGMLAGFDRQTATTFSVYLAIPTLGAVTVLAFLSSRSDLIAAPVGKLALGALAAVAAAWLSIVWLSRYVAGRSFVAFGTYLIVAGPVVFLLSRTALLSGRQRDRGARARVTRRCFIAP